MKKPRRGVGACVNTMSVNSEAFILNAQDLLAGAIQQLDAAD